MNSEIRDLTAGQNNPAMNKTSRLGALNMNREMDMPPERNKEATTSTGIPEHSSKYTGQSNEGKYTGRPKSSSY